MAAEALEQSVLESKDKDQLLAIAKALGLKATSRTKKAEIIDSILEMTGTSAPVAATPNGDLPRSPRAAGLRRSQRIGRRQRRWQRRAGVHADRAPRCRRRPDRSPATGADDQLGQRPVLGADGEPLAEWELALGEHRRRDRHRCRRPSPLTRRSSAPADGSAEVSAAAGAGPAPAGQQPAGAPADGESRNRRRRRRRKGGRGADGPQGDDAGLVEADLESQPGRQRARRGVRVHRHARRGLRLPARQGLPAEP